MDPETSEALGDFAKTSAPPRSSPNRKHGRDAGETSSKRSERRKDSDVAKQSNSIRPKFRKLAPPRPFPTVPTSVSATGPRSAHTEGKNRICVTRKTELGMYLRRCKEVILKDGYKTLYLHAMGAAIPHLARLAASLPSILPFPASDIQSEVRTGTTEVHDEIIPDDEDKDITLRTRGKSTMNVTIKIEGGDIENEEQVGYSSKKRKNDKGRGKESDHGGATDRARNSRPEQLIFAENDLDSADSGI